MAEAEVFLNMIGFLIYLKKNKYDWINAEYASVCLKYNVKDTFLKLL